MEIHDDVPTMENTLLSHIEIVIPMMELQGSKFFPVLIRSAKVSATNMVIFTNIGISKEQ